MDLKKIRAIAQRLLGTGTSKVWFDPKQIEKIQEAMTTDDIRTLIKDGVVRKKKTLLHSRGSARILHAKKRRGRKRGHGKRTGTKKARLQRKTNWIKNVRAQRQYLCSLKKEKKVSGEQYSKIYKLIKGGYFKGKKYIDAYVKGTK